MKIKIPEFKSEATERAYWAKHDSAGRVDWKKGKRIAFAALRPSSRAASARLTPKPRP